MAEEKAPKPATAPPAQQQKPTLFIVLVLVNMFVLLGVGVMLYMNKQKQAKQPTIDGVITETHNQDVKDAQSEEFIGKLVPMETFLVNLAQSRGRKLAKVNMEFEVSGSDVQNEIDELKPKIRDIVIIILSSKTYAQVSAKEGKDSLREEIRDKVNLFLTKGRIERVYFTEFIYN